MTRKNIKVSEELFEALQEDKRDEETWPHYLERKCLCDVGDLSPFGGEVPDLNEQFSCDMSPEQLKRVESSLEVIEARTGRIEQTLEGMQGR